MLDWSKLNNKSFEGFCYDIASEYYKDKGNIDFEANLSSHNFDFYLKISNQEIWAWEAKYYKNLKKVSIRKIQDILRQIESRASNSNNNLTRIILCLPSTLTLEAENWFNEYCNTQQAWIQNIKLEIWNSDFFETLYMEEKYHYIFERYFNNQDISSPVVKDNNDNNLSSLNYWWVCQGGSYQEGLNGGYIQAPNDGIWHHMTLTEIKPGDIIINYANSEIKAISKVLSESQNIDINEQAYLRAKLKYLELQKPIGIKLLREIFINNIEVLPNIHSPFNKNFNINQGYLFYFNKISFDLIFTKSKDPALELLNKLNITTLNKVNRIDKPCINGDITSDKDLMAREIYAKAFAELITNKKNKTPFTIGIYGKWGTGKTNFIEFIENEIEVINNNSKLYFDNYWRFQLGYHYLTDNSSNFYTHIVKFNAWKYDDQNKVWAALLKEIIKKYESEKPVTSKLLGLGELFSLGNWLRGIFAFILTLAGYKIFAMLGVNINSSDFILKKVIDNPPLGSFLVALTTMVITKFTNLFQSIEKKFTSYFSTSKYDNYLGIRAEIEKNFDRIIKSWLYDKNGNEVNRLLIIIDDLDRCSQEHILQVLEAVQLFLDNKGIISILAMDHSVIDKAVLKKYKDVNDNIDSNLSFDYLEKIIQIPFILPVCRNLTDYLCNLSNVDKRDICKLLEQNNEESPGHDEESPGHDEESPGHDKKSPGHDEESPGHDKKSPGQIQDINVNSLELDEQDQQALLLLQPYYDPNPRRLKRFINIYRLTRYLICNNKECFVDYDRLPLAKWLLICTLWPKLSKEIANKINSDEYFNSIENLINMSYLFKPNEKGIYTKDKDKVLNLLKVKETSLSYSINEIKQNFIPVTDCFLFHLDQ